jgi:DNA-binding PadR family transcriptional regulator
MLTTLEFYLLLAIAGVDRAYGVALQAHIGERTGQTPHTGSIYAGLDRLTARGLIKMHTRAPLKQRGGRGGRYYSLTAAGRHARDKVLAAIAALGGADRRSVK